MPFYDVADMPLGPELAAHTGLPVYIQHDVCARTIAESLFGASRGASDVIQIVIDDNVGAGVITGGRLLHNSRSSLVEIGHTQVDARGKQCYCGNHGCLETVASIGSILELAAQRMPSVPSSSLHYQPLSVDSLCDAALNGDPLARDIITGIGNSVGRILAIMVNLFNPEKFLSVRRSTAPPRCCIPLSAPRFVSRRCPPTAPTSVSNRPNSPIWVPCRAPRWLKTRCTTANCWSNCYRANQTSAILQKLR